MYFKYGLRGPSEACSIKATALTDGNWNFIPYGEPLNPLPLVCYSAIAHDGIYVAWQRYPPTRQCAVRGDLYSAVNAPFQRANCTANFLADAARKVDAAGNITTPGASVAPKYPSSTSDGAGGGVMRERKG